MVLLWTELRKLEEIIIDMSTILLYTYIRIVITILVNMSFVIVAPLKTLAAYQT